MYGSTSKGLNGLRFGVSGVLKGQNEGISFLLPDEPEICVTKRNPNSLKTFLAGDLRVNENPGLSAMHTAFAREHNRIAKAIKALAWQKSDEDIMHEVKKYLYHCKVT